MGVTSCLTLLNIKGSGDGYMFDHLSIIPLLTNTILVQREINNLPEPVSWNWHNCSCWWHPKETVLQTLEGCPVGLLMAVCMAKFTTRLILQGEGNCFHAHWSLPWCPWNVPVETYNFPIGCPSPRRNCLGALALKKKRSIQACNEIVYHCFWLLTLCSYLMNVTCVMMRKTEGRKLSGNPSIEHLVEIRTVLERMRPIDQKLHYQVDKLVKTAATGTIAENDPLRYKPNPGNLLSKVSIQYLTWVLVILPLCKCAPNQVVSCKVAPSTAHPSCFKVPPPHSPQCRPQTITPPSKAACLLAMSLPCKVAPRCMFELW